MVYIPTALLKKLMVFAALLLPLQTRAQAPDRQLLLADSLFQQKKYIQAFQTYQALEKQGAHSAAMLLRMAYIQEGLGHTAESLLYLNRYWAASADDQVLEKIQSVAQKKNLSGYDYTTADRIKLVLAQHRAPIAIGGSGILVLLLALSAYLTRKKNPARWFALTGVMVFAVGLAYTISVARVTSAGISRSATYLMQGPSAGSSVVARIEAGHRLPLKGEQDIWIKTEWGGSTVYARQTAVQLISSLTD